MENGNDRIQRALNEKKRRDLEEMYGAKFGPPDPTLPPDVENDWLTHVEEFERQWAANGRTTVREFIGAPSLRPLAVVPPAELESELEQIMDLLFVNNIIIHFGRQVSDAEVYRFVTEELLDHEMDNIRIEGMMHTFIYEEFHPDDAADARMGAEYFFASFFSRDRRALWRMLCKEEVRDTAGGESSPERFMKRLEEFYTRITAFTSHSAAVCSVDVEGDHASVRATVTWSGLDRGSLAVVAGGGEALLSLRRNEACGWDLVRAHIPGWNDRSS